MSAEKEFPVDVSVACDLLDELEEEQVRRLAHRQYLTPRERELRDTLLEILALDFPIMVYEYRELNQRLDEAAERKFA